MIPSSIQIQHIKRNLSQKLNKVAVGVIGGYHGGNLGDMALGMAVSEALKTKKISHGLQTIYNLEKWPKTPYAIIGGGAVGYTNSLQKVAARYTDEYNNVAFLGVDFNEKSYPAECINMLKKAAFISCRSQSQASKMKDLTGRNDISSHPDIAFSLLNPFCRQVRSNASESKKKNLLINILPLYASVKNGTIVPAEQYRSERPELFENFSRMHDNYKEVLRAVVEQNLSEGYTVETIPFTKADELYGKVLLKGLSIHHAVYHADPVKMLTHIASSERVIATRFHATIFALKTGARLYPVAYAKKNEEMLKELGVSNYISTDTLALGDDQKLGSFVADDQKITDWEATSADHINRCISSLPSFS